MKPRTVDIPRLVEVSSGCQARIPALLASEFDTARTIVASGRGPSCRFAQAVVDRLREHGIAAEHKPGYAGRLDDAAELAADSIRRDATLLVGVGGGRVVDSAKLAAARSGAEFVSVPTTISHDGISSPVASLIGGDGRRGSFAAAMPAGIIIDLGVVGSAPARTLRAGFGDLLSNLVALLDWELAASRGLETFDAFSAMIAEKAARSVLEVSDVGGIDAQELLAKGLLLSGLAMATAGTSRPCSGAEHLISHSLDATHGERAMHGEQVALGCLFAAAAHDSPLAETLAAAFGRLGLPRSPADIGFTSREFEQAVLRAPETRPDRFTVLTDLVAGGGDRIPKLVERTFAPSRAR